MIDPRGRLLHAIILKQIEEESETISDPLSVAMERFDKYMNKLNGTTNKIYDDHGEVLMEC